MSKSDIKISSRGLSVPRGEFSHIFAISGIKNLAERLHLPNFREGSSILSCLHYRNLNFFSAEIKFHHRAIRDRMEAKNSRKPRYRRRNPKQDTTESTDNSDKSPTESHSRIDEINSIIYKLKSESNFKLINSNNRFKTFKCTISPKVQVKLIIPISSTKSIYIENITENSQTFNLVKNFNLKVKKSSGNSSLLFNLNNLYNNNNLLLQEYKV